LKDNKAHENAWLIGNRSLPVPDGASDVLRKAIEDTPAPDVTESLKSVPKSEDEWLAVIEDGDNEMMESVKAIKEQSPVTIERNEIEGVNVYHVTPEEIDPKHDQHLFVYIHGGGYMLFGGEAGLGEAIYIARSAKIPVLSIDYRMAPQHPFPSGLEDVLIVYK
jgi:monoterpene epsilon-lactone hydrolase